LPEARPLGEEDAEPTEPPSSVTRPEEFRIARTYGDESLEPSEQSVRFPTDVDEDGAADDYARFEDGPILSDDPSALNAADSPTVPDVIEAESCAPAFSACRMDTDCCGDAVCRARPGTISGSFECTGG
jgi:hypothetical protein